VHPPRLHQVRQPKPHVKHTSNITTLPCSFKSNITIAVVRKRYYLSIRYYAQKMEFFS
jgi:hypothetical protein